MQEGGEIPSHGKPLSKPDDVALIHALATAQGIIISMDGEANHVVASLNHASDST